MGVHNIHITVDDAEYMRLKMAKGKKTWHDFLMETCEKQNEQY